jgi:transcriptional regulator with XRE-family HTH domain/tetratricopeptide (TPR) repeat protein
MPGDASFRGATRRQRLAQRRKALGLTQEALADLLGVERSTVIRWERGESQPLPGIRPKLAKVLRVSTDRIQELLDNGRAPGLDASQTGPVPTVPRQLPAAVAVFTGRAAELEKLTRMMEEATDDAPGTVVISAIAGTAGVGKTVLGLHWAHQVAGRFEDGQLYVNLRGFDPVSAPVTAAEAVRGFLDTLGVPSERVPATPNAQASLYRSLLSDRRMLIVLDNARDEEQVRPLLPASPGSLMLVTSRNRLAGLAAVDGARMLTLDLLPLAEAIELLAARVGRTRAAAEPDAIAEIARLCACLPLALAVAGARATVRPGFPLAVLAAELREASGRLAILDAGDPMASVRSVFSWSYHQLSSETGRMFRLLGLASGPDITVPAAASLAGTGEREARRMFRDLTEAHLIAEHAPGRYTFHDLLRSYADTQARAIDTESERAAAIGRMLDHYLHTACASALRLYPWHEPMPLRPVSLGAAPEPISDYRQAMTWFEVEHDVLFAAIARAAGSGFDRHAWQLPWAMSDHLELRGHWHEWAAAERIAVEAAVRLGDTAGQEVSRRLLGRASFVIGDDGQASAQLRESLELCRRLGNRYGAARVHWIMGRMAERQGRYAEALRCTEQARELFRASGNTAGEAEMLNNIGWFHSLLGHYQRALEFGRLSLTLSTEIGHRHNKAHVWHCLGVAEHHLGNFSEAIASFERGITIYLEFDDRYNEAWILGNLGDTYHAAGDLPQARQAWQRALGIFRDLGDPGAARVRAKLEGIDG